MTISILDACCGTKMMWFDRSNPDVLFADNRNCETSVPDRSHGQQDKIRAIAIRPMVVHDYRSMPYRDGAFSMVVLDPPHLRSAGPKSWMAAKYGKLGPEWKSDLSRAFSECFRVLEAGGVLVFKWAETNIQLSEVLKCAQATPQFGNRAGKRAGTHWLLFIKPQNESSQA